MRWQEQSTGCRQCGRKPAWWLLYTIGLLLVGGIGLLEFSVQAGALRTVLECVSVVLGFTLMLVWQRHNRAAFDVRRGRPVSSG